MGTLYLWVEDKLLCPLEDKVCCPGIIISERIFKIMEERGMSQIEFSKATGIAQSTISEWKRKITNPAADKIMVICEVLTLLLVVFATLTYIDNHHHK